MRKITTNEQQHTQPQFRLKPVYAAVLLAFTVQTVQANPLDPTVVSGQASFATSGSTLTVTNTPGAIINWQGFSIGANEITRFNQQSASSAVLNRVISSNPSSILGTLQSNGRVFLINPNGIVFGAGATVDVAGLVASTLNLSDDDFLAGRNRFASPLTQAGEGSGVRVVNQGDITAQDGGQIFLIAPDVENTGVITAPNGEILLAAGYSVDLVSTSDPNLRINITAPAGDATNVGQLIASSGSLGLFGTVVRNSGTVSANSATMQGGKIVFRSTQRTEAGGTVSAQGAGGGEIKMLSDMQTGAVNVTGTLDASAPVGGDGGFIDTSAAHVQVADTARVSTLAANGNNGMWLIDPTDYYVSATDPANGSSWMSNTTLSTNLGFGNVTIQTLATGAVNGDIFVNDAVSWSSANSLTLNAIRNVNINAAISNSGTGNLVVRADLNGSSIGTIIFGASGSVALTGGLADLYYNPVSYTDTTTKSDALTNPYSTKITGTYTAWMLVNNVGLETGGTLGLQAMNTNRAGNYALGRNIDASGTNLWNAGAGFVPVGDGITNFTGKLDGQNRTISNLSMNNLGDAGLFGVIGAGGVVANVGLLNSNVVAAGSTVGGLAANNLGTISNCYISNGTVLVAGAYSSVGGLVGINSGTIISSYVSGGSVQGEYGGVGGLVGFNNSTGLIDKSYVSNVSVVNAATWGASVGGMVGYNSGTISNSYVSGGTVTGVNALGAGGLVGYNAFAGIISSNYVSGVAVSGKDKVGGLVGNNGGSINNDYVIGGSVNSSVTSGYSLAGLVGFNSGTIGNTYVSGGTVTSGVGYAAGLVGNHAAGSISNSFWDANMSLLYTVFTGAGTQTNIGSRTTALMMTQANYTGWDFTNIWWMSDTNTRPFLRSEWSTTITDSHQLQLMAMNLGASYTLGANIDMAETATGTGMWSSAGFVQIGTSNLSPFTGQLDGMGYTINNLTINRPTTSFVGLFGGLGWNAVVSNVGLVGGSVSGWSRVGALAAYNYGSISNSYVSGMNISGCGSCSNIGGLVGLNDFNITSSYVDGGSISGGWYVGGLVGRNWSGTIDSSHVIGGIGSSISGSGAVGGLVGWNQNNIIGSHVSSGDVGGGPSVGGLVGKNSELGSSISNSYVDTGTVVSGNVSVGGLLGWDSGEGIITGNTVTDTTVNGNSFVGGLIGKYSVSAWSSAAGYTDNNQVINSFVDGGTVTGLYVGGLVGWNGSSLRNSSVSGTTVKGLSNVGGLVGYNDTAGSSGFGTTISYWSGYISNSYVNSGSVTGTSAVGGLVGANNGIISNSHYNINGVLINAVNQVTRYGLYNDVLNISGIGQYDDWFNGGLMTPLDIADYAMLPGSAGSHTINSLQGMKALLGFAEDAAYTFSLAANVNLATVPGYYIPYLAANFDGANFTISNLNLTLNNSEVGLFGHIAVGSSVSNVKLLNAAVTGYWSVGALAGYNEGDIFNSNSTGGTVIGNSFVGGLVGRNIGGNGGAAGPSGGAAGLPGSAASISDSYVSGGTVSGVSYVGGLAGQNLGGAGGAGGYFYSGIGSAGGAGGAVSISNSYVSGTTVNGDSYVGGLVGKSLGGNGGAGGNTYFGTGGAGGAGGAATISGSYVSGVTTTAIATDIGGLVGSNASGVAGANGLVLATGGVAGAGGAAGAAAISSGYVNGGSVTSTYTGWSVALNLGGLAGYNGGSISTSYVSGGSVVASATDLSGAVGGLAGYNAGTISNTYVSGGSVNGNGAWEIGGLVGVNAVGGNISYSYAATGMTSAWGHEGLVSTNDGIVLNSIWNTDLVPSGIGFGSGTATVTGLTTAQMMTMSNFTGWDIANTGGAAATWRIYEGNTTPLLTSFLTPLTVTANNAVNTYDGNTFSGGNGVTTSIVGAVVSGTPIFSGDSQGAKNAGSYVISASGLYSGQQGYDISYADGTLTVNPATLTYTANTTSRLYGGIDPAFSGSVTGFVLGENLASATTGTETYSTAALNSSNVGSYAITGSGLSANNGNYVFVQAAGNSSALTINPATLTVTANAAAKTYDGLAFSGGNGVTYTGFVNSETSAVLSGTLVYGGSSQGAVNAGSYLITPGGWTSSNYTISYVDGTLTITPAALTLLSVTANDASKIYGTTLTFAGTEFTPIGLQGSDTISGVTLTSAGATATANAGVYAITPGNAVFSVGNAGNYTLSYVDGQLTVTAAPLAISADLQTKVYGNTDPVLTYVASGLLFSDTLTGGLSRAVGENAGNYAINQGTLANANYAITFNGNNLSITARPINVTADAVSRVYGDADPVLTYTVGGMGLAAWDTNATAFTGALTRAAGEDVATGPYAISQGNLAANANYTITGYTGNVMSITPAPLLVSANDANKIMNTSDPLLTYMVAGLKLSDTEASTLSGELSRAAGETAGTYPIDQGTLVLLSTNYTLTYVAGSFTILVPTVVDEIVNTSLMFSPDTGSAESTSSSDEEEDKAAEEVVAAADTAAAEGEAAPPLPVCPM